MNLDIQVRELLEFVDAIWNFLPEYSSRIVSVNLVSDAEMTKLNKQFRHTDSTTDVLSFPHQAEPFEDEDFLGEIVISAQRARSQAIENKLSYETELKQLTLHSVLHLCGYDHETDDGEMNGLELRLRDKLGIS